MATILKFRVRRVAKRATGAERAADSAEIVIFPGVRYERWSDGAPVHAADGKIKRDTLKLAE